MALAAQSCWDSTWCLRRADRLQWFNSFMNKLCSPVCSDSEESGSRAVNAIILRSEANARRPTPVLEHRRVALRIFTALAEMSAMRAGKAEWSDLADSCNVVEALSELGKFDADQVVPVLNAAKDGLKVAIKCADGQMRMRGDKLQALRRVVSLHDEAVGKFSLATMFEAERRVIATVRRVMAGDETGVTVVYG